MCVKVVTQRIPCHYNCKDFTFFESYMAGISADSNHVKVDRSKSIRLGQPRPGSMLPSAAKLDLCKSQSRPRSEEAKPDRYATKVNFLKQPLGAKERYCLQWAHVALTRGITRMSGYGHSKFPWSKAQGLTGHGRRAQPSDLCRSSPHENLPTISRRFGPLGKYRGAALQRQHLRQQPRRVGWQCNFLDAYRPNEIWYLAESQRRQIRPGTKPADDPKVQDN
jgi:hypothetical protein